MHLPRVPRNDCFLLQLTAIGIQPENITFKNVTLESERYIAVRESGTLVIVDMAQPQAPARRQISADSAIMAPDRKVIALKAVTPGTPGDNLQVFNLDTKTKLKTYQMPESVEYWKWTSPTRLGLVTATSVYHWDVEVRQLCMMQNCKIWVLWASAWILGLTCTSLLREPLTPSRCLIALPTFKVPRSSATV